MNIAEIIFEEAKRHPDKVAIVRKDSQISYMEMVGVSKMIAGALKQYGVKPCDRVAFLCNDGIEYVLFSLAILSLGAAIIPMDSMLSDSEKKLIPEKMEAQWLIAESSLSSLPTFGKILDLNNQKNLSKKFYFSKYEIPAEHREGYRYIQPAFIRFSSGTTGNSKGVVLSHETIYARIVAANKGLEITSSDVVVFSLSMSFHFVVSVLLFLYRGATILSCNLFMIAETLKRYRPTVMYGNPMDYYAILGSGEIYDDALKSVRLAVSTGVRLTPGLAREFYEFFAVRLTEAYGIIEVGLPFVHKQTGNFKTGFLGTPLPDFEVKCDSHGDVFLRGPGFFDAYFDPWIPYPLKKTDGWFHTGDVGTLDAKNCLTLKGRSTSVINFLGYKIFPQEVEDILNTHPDIAESLVCGKNNRLMDQTVHAQIVLKNPAKKLSANDIKDFCRPFLSGEKIPTSYTFVESLPKTLTGKLRRTGKFQD